MYNIIDLNRIEPPVAVEQAIIATAIPTYDSLCILFVSIWAVFRFKLSFQLMGIKATVFQPTFCT